MIRVPLFRLRFPRSPGRAAEPANRVVWRVAVWLSCVAIYGGICVAETPSPALSADGPPALVVVVSVDQWRQEYLDRFRGGFREQGLMARVARGGLMFTNCQHAHAFTYTGPGHAVLLTGAYPDRSGIIGNSWYDRGKKKTQYCVGDSTARIVGSVSDEDPVSPRNMLADTVGDSLKLATRGAGKVFGVAIKDRAAILMAGAMADGAYWMANDGNWITTDHYSSELPGYLRQLNETGQVRRFAGQVWQRLLPAEQYVHGAEEDSFGERPVYGMTADFPHELPAADDSQYVRRLVCSPFGNEATLDGVRAVLEFEQLGRDDTPDLLTVNFSSTDYVGHSHGPYSLEVEDMAYRTDLALGALAEDLERQMMGRPWVMFVTADHGVAPIPERAARWKLNARRNPLGASGSLGNIESMRKPLETYLREQLQVDDDAANLVELFAENQVYLSAEHPALRGAQAAVARQLVKQWLTRRDEILAAATRDDLEAGPHEELLGLFQRSYHPGRSGDVLFALTPYSFQSGLGATHGSPWLYDRHVPLLVVGNLPALRQPAGGRRVDRAVSPAAIAPTAAQLMQIDRPAACAELPLPELFR